MTKDNQQFKNSATNISKQDMLSYAKYVVTGKVEDDKHKKELQNIAKKECTLADVTTLLRFMTANQDNYNTQIISAIQIHERVLEKLGATDEIFNEANDEYNQIIEDKKKAMEQKAEADKESGGE